MATFNFNNIKGSMQVIEKAEGTVIQNNGFNSEQVIQLVQSIKAEVAKHQADDEHSKELIQIVSETEAALSGNNRESALSGFVERVQGWINTGEKITSMAVGAKALVTAISALTGAA